VSRDSWLFDQTALQEYILCACQAEEGGLIDKPGRYPDFYHTCFCLSGLSLAQHGLSKDELLGPADNLLKSVHPVYNLTIEAVQLAKTEFSVPFIPMS
jgi:prenyltransferase beta subunit